MPTLIGKHITISDGLQGQDDHFETLMSLWEELQLCSLDSAVHPECDLLSFSQSAFLLGVITLNKDPDPFKVAPLNLDSSVWTPVTPYDYKLDSVDDAILEELVGVKNPPANPAWNLVPSPRGGNLNTSQSAQPAESIWTPYQYQRDSDEDAMLEDLVRGNSSSSFRPLTNANPVWDPVPSEPRGGSFMKNLMVQKANAEKTRSAGFFVPGPSNPKLDVADKLNFHSSTPTLDTRKPSSLYTSSPLAPTWSTNSAVEPKRVLPSRSRMASSSIAPPPPSRSELFKAAEAGATKKAIGLIYLASSPLAPSPIDQVGELNLGIILDAAHRGQGYAREAIRLVVKHAFDVRHCHRIQASLLRSSTKDRMVSLLTHLRFGHEGTKRRAFFNPMMAEWQDVTTLAILDTDWAMRSLYKSAPKSLWDELFLRHERERDELLRWEETQQRLKRTNSMETLRAVPLEPESNSTSESDAELSSASSAPASSKGKRRALPSSRQDPYDGLSSEADSDFNDDDMFPLSRYTPDPVSRFLGASSPALSEASLESVPRSVITSGSDWDMLESSSSGSSSYSDVE